MAMKKAEMEEHAAQYQALLIEVARSERDGLFRRAVELALSACEHIDGMMQYMRKYEEEEFESIEALDIVFQYSPLLLDFPSLDRVESILKDNRRIEKYTSEKLRDKLNGGRALLWDAHRLWDHLEFHADTTQEELCRTLGGTEHRWNSIIEAWEQMGLLHRTLEGWSYRLTLCTRMGKIVSAKCPSCGGLTEAPKAMFLEQMTCPRCKAKVLFVILAAKTSADVKE